MIPVSESIQLTDAEKNVIDTQHLVKHMKGCFIVIGGLLKANKEAAYWSMAGFESWRDYVEQLGIGEYTLSTRLIKIFEIATSQVIAEADIYEIGMEKMKLLLPLFKDGTPNQVIIELAKNCTNRELRQQLGLKVPHNDSNHHVVCSRCGCEILGAKWVKKDELNPS